MPIFIDEKDRVRINAFLVSPAGKALLVHLREYEQRPKIRPGVPPHEVQMDAGAQVGYDECLRKIETFIVKPVEKHSIDDGTPKLRRIALRPSVNPSENAS